MNQQFSAPARGERTGGQRTAYRGLGGLLACLLVASSSGCCFLRRIVGSPCHEENAYALTRIQKLPFMGGSLAFDSVDPSSSHLSAGTRIPIRLSALVRSSISPDDLPDDVRAELAQAGTELYEYEEKPGAEVFGLIEISAIDLVGVSLDATLFDTAGKRTIRRVKIAAGQQGDLDGNGVPDIEYVASISAARTAAPSRMYLRFISSQETLSSAMFSFAPDLLPSLRAPRGNLGFNIDGHAIIRLGTKKRTLTLSRGTEAMAAPGDFILDEDAGKYLRVTARGAPKRANPSGEFSALEALDSVEPVQSMAVVLPVFAMATSAKIARERRMDTAAASSSRVVRDQAAYQARMKRWSDALAGYALHKRFDIPTKFLQECKAGACVGLLELAATLAVDVDASVTWSHARGTIKTAVMLDGLLGASNSAGTTATIRESMKSLWSTYWGTTFTIGPVIIDVGVRPDVGYKAQASLGAGAKMGVRFAAVWGGQASVDVRWSRQTGSATSFEDAFVFPDLKLIATAGAQAFLMPYIGLGAEVRLEKLLFVLIPATVFAGPYWEITATSETGLAEMKAGIKIGFDVRLIAGAGVRIQIFGKDLYKEWTPVNVPLYHWELSIWEETARFMLFKAGDGSSVAEVRYPAVRCAPPLVPGKDGQCIDPRPPQIPPTDDGKPEARTITTIFLKRYAGDKPRHLIFKGEYRGGDAPGAPGAESFERRGFYDLPEKKGCWIDGKYRCSELDESFTDLKPGLWNLQIWSDDGYVLWSSSEVRVTDDAWTVVKCTHKNACRAIEHTLGLYKKWLQGGKSADVN